LTTSLAIHFLKQIALEEFNQMIREGIKMKKWIIASITALMLFSGLHGCASLSCNEAMKHGSIWKSWDHAYFSYSGYKNPTSDEIKKSAEEGWWGCPIEVELNK
jgi:hypothetical protein